MILLEYPTSILIVSSTFSHVPVNLLPANGTSGMICIDRHT